MNRQIKSLGCEKSHLYWLGIRLVSIPNQLTMHQYIRAVDRLEKQRKNEGRKRVNRRILKSSLVELELFCDALKRHIELTKSSMKHIESLENSLRLAEENIAKLKRELKIKA